MTLTYLEEDRVPRVGDKVVIQTEEDGVRIGGALKSDGGPSLIVETVRIYRTDEIVAMKLKEAFDDNNVEQPE